MLCKLVTLQRFLLQQTPPEIRKSVLKYHRLLQGCSLVASIVGIAAIYYSKESKNKAHLTTWHSWIGIMTFVIHLMVGSLKATSSFMPRLFGVKINRIVRSSHITVGYGTLWLLFITSSFGTIQSM